MQRVPTHPGDWHTLIAFQDVHVPTTDIETACVLVLEQAGVSPETAGRIGAAVGIAATLYGGASVARLSGHVVHVDYRLAEGRLEVLLHRAADEPGEARPDGSPENTGWQAVREVFDAWGRPPGPVLLGLELVSANRRRG